MAPGRPQSTLQYLKEAYERVGEALLTRACSDRTGGKVIKLKEAGLDQILRRNSPP